MTHTLTGLHSRWRALATTCGAAALAASALMLPATATGAAAVTAAATDATPWPSSPDWQSYVETPSASTVCPTAIESTSGTVTGAQNLVCGGSGGATLTMTSGGATPTIVLDYGQEVGGLPYFGVSAESGSPVLRAGVQRGTELPVRHRGRLDAVGGRRLLAL